MPDPDWVAQQRKMHRTLVQTILCNEQEAWWFIPAWNPHVAVLVPAGTWPVGYQGHLHFFVWTNIGAEHARELVFDRFEVIPVD